MRRCRGAGLAALAALLLVASGRAQLQQETFLETTEGTSINITCSHSNKRSGDYIHFYRQLPGRAPEFLALTARGSKDVPAIAGKLTISEDGRSSALWLAGPRRGDAAVYYCALGARPEQPGLRPGTNRRGRGQQGALPLRPPGAAFARFVPGCWGAACTGTDLSTSYGTKTDTGTHSGIGNGRSSLESPTSPSPSSQHWLKELLLQLPGLASTNPIQSQSLVSLEVVKQILTSSA
ncbi:LOW QUALITY PROTEIN: uncharacterized protein LOC132338994 [Haemorhous mexicanus]|uniref:LOW QUALITY PROTEIN: uncharacterized protein LOC132338994 n=1 Tax=Haemorhous mexicanus TaxID=30427 RepID=UPI0028BD4D23|nr:LOW QUALITY PROTEIN: uncharacterized protein LOC132338994 [Haemorhous mexicanus]